MSRIKYFEEESLPDNAVNAAISLKINTGNIFDPQTAFSEKGDFIVPKFKTAYLVFILNSRKLQRLHIESYYDEANGKIYGQFINKQQKSAKGDKTEPTRELKKWIITSVTTLIDLKTESGKSFFAACCKDRQVAGTERAYPVPYFRIEVPELRAEAENEQYEVLEEALAIVSAMKEKELDDLATMLNITGYAGGTLTQKRGILRKAAISNPKDVVEAKKNEDMGIIIQIKRAIDAKVVKEIKGVFVFADYQLGTSHEMCVYWAKQNPDVFQVICESTQQKTNKK